MADQGGDYGALENYLQSGTAPGTTGPDEPGQAVNWMAGKWEDWRQARLREQEQQPNLLQTNPFQASVQAAMGFMPMGMAGVLGGRLAAGADLKALKMATEMEKAGYAQHQIWHDTGWFKGADKNWKFEIPDPQGMLNLPGYKAGSTAYGHSALPEAINHPELFQQYPELKESLFAMRSKNRMGNAIGQSIPGWGIRLRDDVVQSPTLTNEVLAHELQHAVQDIEGFAEGTNSEEVAGALRHAGNNMLAADPYEAYNATAGEIEARNIGQRASMGPTHRKALSPADSAEQIHNQVFLHQGHVYTPIEHDPFQGLAEERAGLGRDQPKRKMPKTVRPDYGGPL